MRRISTGTVGKPVLGNFVVEDNTLTPLNTNGDITLTPDGTGVVQSSSALEIRSGNNLRLQDNDNSNYLDFAAPATVTSNTTFTFPDGAGTNGYFLQTNGSGTLSWAESSTGITNEAASGSTFYPTLTTSTSGSVTGISVSSTQLTFVPNTGRLTANGGFSDGTATLASGSISSAVNGTFSGTVQCGTLTETSSIAYKENINPIENALDKILSLQGIIFDRRDGSRLNEAGLIAEEVEKVIPEVVMQKDGKAESINYSKLTAFLIEAVKDLQKQIADLK